MKNILILMSTYNGYKYLAEQFDSIINQNNINWKILVRDDGSCDNGKTISIIRHYLTKYPEHIALIEGNNIGWKKSFFELLIIASSLFDDVVDKNLEPVKGIYDYYAFSDQDDIWLPDKLGFAVDALDAISNPIKLYCSNLFYFKDGENKGPVWKTSQILPTIKNCLVRNFATGCTVVFSLEVLKLLSLKRQDNPYAHDFRAYQTTILCGGKVFVDQTPHILYRQHDSNQIGMKKGWKEIWNRRSKTFRDTYRKREKIAYQLNNSLNGNLTPQAAIEVNRILNYRKGLNRFKLICDKGYTTGLKSNDRWLRLRMLLGIF